jgi:hypothetical protein
MTRRAKHTPAPPQKPDQVRTYWRSLVLDTAMRHASLLEFLPPGERDIRKPSPPPSPEQTIGKCRELLDRCCAAEATGEGRARIEQRMGSELWNFMKMLAPSTRFPAHARNDIGFTAEMFQPLEDTPWPTANP